jgi:hypothetical protein
MARLSLAPLQYVGMRNRPYKSIDRRLRAIDNLPAIAKEGHTASLVLAGYLHQASQYF